MDCNFGLLYFFRVPTSDIFELKVVDQNPILTGKLKITPIFLRVQLHSDNCESFKQL